MKAAVYYGTRDVRIEHRPEPRQPGPGEVLLAVSRAGICGTDVSEYLHGPHVIPIHRPDPATGYQGPVILGHEFAGRVVAAGPDVAHFSPGQRVASGAGVWCGACAWCQAGRPNLCARYYTLGLQADGGLAALVRVPAKTCWPVPSACSDEAAALAQPLAVAIHAVTRSGVAPHEHLAVLGVGGIGSLIVAAARARGVRTIVAVDVDRNRLGVADALGATRVVHLGVDDPARVVHGVTGGDGADVVIESAGVPAAMDLAPCLVRRGGRILQVGLPHDRHPLNVRDLVLREVTLLTTVAHVCPTDLPEAVRLLATTDVAAHVLDRVIALDDLIDDGLLALATRRAGAKIVVDPQA
jgi:(R,R)-butanediol dehydrogenase/meso-butanediol dehydrogenase/diacetyl reductase